MLSQQYFMVQISHPHSFGVGPKFFTKGQIDRHLEGYRLDYLQKVWIKIVKLWTSD
jgi:hypothetical protein